MKWSKRLKWARLSKIIIPIALAITLIFAGFTVYADKAENFVIKINNNNDVKLSLTLNRDLTDQTAKLLVPMYDTSSKKKTPYTFSDATYTPDPCFLYNRKEVARNLPDDIAKHDGVNPIFKEDYEMSFFSFSFWLVNNSARAVDVSITMKIDEITHGPSTSTFHIDDAVRVMFIEGEPLLSEETYTVYKKPDRTYDTSTVKGQQLSDAAALSISNIAYGNTKEFASDRCIFERNGKLGITDFAAGDTRRFTVVLWLEGWDPECIDQVRFDGLKMSLEFKGE